MSTADSAGMTTTSDALLGGRIVLDQPARGWRASADALLLAAAIPARAGEKVIEAGIGTGAAALALASRVADSTIVGIEREADHARLARDNAALNGFDTRIAVIEGDIADMTAARLAERGIAPRFDHAMANPPFFTEGDGRTPASASRKAAMVAEPGALPVWVARLADLLKGGGTLTMVHRAGAIDQLLAAFTRHLGGIVVVPLSPRAGADAMRILVQGTKGSRAAPRIAAPLVLHQADGGHSHAAEAILRGGAALDLAAAPVRVTLPGGAR